jgi:nicotinamidase-related amidase
MPLRNGLDSLLRPEDSVLVLIDHQAFQLTNVNSHDPQAVVNNVTALAKLAKAFKVPTILTSVLAARGGLLFKQITDVFPEQEVIDRTWVNTWQDKKVVDLVKATGRKQLIIAGLWTEVCVAMPVIQALGEGWDVTVITDASGGVGIPTKSPTDSDLKPPGIPISSRPSFRGDLARGGASLAVKI